MTEDDTTAWEPQSTFWIDLGWASVGLVPSFFIPFVMSLVATTSVVIGSVVICALGLAVFALLSGELIDDWWDDFKETNRVTILGLTAAVIVPPLGAYCGALI